MKKITEHSAASVMTGRLNAMLRDRKACLKHDDLEAVHDLRVATRRMRAALQLFAPFSPNEIGQVYSPIRRLTREIGHLRNLDEALLFFQQEIDASGNESLYSGLLERLRAQHGHEAVRVHTLLRRLDVVSMKHSLMRIVPNLPGPDSCNVSPGKSLSLPGYLSQTGIELFSKIHRLVPLSITPEAVETRHALRIAIKRWRYFIEIVAELTQLDYALLLETLKEYQSLLGHLNDLSVFAMLPEEGEFSDEERSRFDSTMESLRLQYFGQFLEVLRQQPLHYVFLF